MDLEIDVDEEPPDPEEAKMSPETVAIVTAAKQLSLVYKMKGDEKSFRWLQSLDYLRQGLKEYNGDEYEPVWRELYPFLHDILTKGEFIKACEMNAIAYLRHLAEKGEIWIRA